ncbi:MAG: hypothetical protein KJN94_08475 [Gammaproteobacteria bacterium]|nr:hypothetical protein [Gammaproteobacteria bacterium]
MKEVYWSESPVQRAVDGGTGSIVLQDGEPFYRIHNYHVMPPFLVSLVSGTEHWMFVSSAGGLTCGRRNPDHALFPYETDDKVHDSVSTTGPFTALLVEDQGKTRLWTPFSGNLATFALERNLYKNLPGNRLVFEEVNHDLDLVFRYGWSVSDRFGFVKRSCIVNTGRAGRRIELLDGLRNLLPFGVTRQTQTGLSTLLDAYKQAEAVPGLCAGVYSLSSILTDRAEPCEALKATVAWSTGLPVPQVLLSEDQVEAFLSGVPVESEPQARGRRGAFLVQSAFTLAPDSEHSWYVMADIDQGPSRLAGLLGQIRKGVAAATIEADIDSGGERLQQLVGGADGFQVTSDALTTARHFANTLFNIMRGGTFYDEYTIPRNDFIDFVATWNRPLAEVFQGLLDGQETLTRKAVLRAAESSGDPDLQRLALEYLPLTFSRRHGDPSRPWNHFSIDIQNEDGSDKLYFQGNWRDIFQNWEALSLSYPDYIESFVTKFVNASTADGYNPYRITRGGFDWEVLEPDNSWSNIGYWGDHQVNYLVKLLELSLAYHPGEIGDWLSRDVFVYANVPYRIKGYEALLSDPRDTVLYDEPEAAAIAGRVEGIGSDGTLLTLGDGSIYRVNLLEKLLVPVLSKLGNLVPGGGIWMNTQRPEWNDANNALVGFGLSMVTLCYLRRYLKVFACILADGKEERFSVSAEVADFFAGIGDVLQQSRSMLDGAVESGARKAFVDALGRLGEQYRERVYSGFSGGRSPVTTPDLLAFIELALEFIDHSIAANRRPDGLYHSYNLIHFGPDGYDVEHLYEMLEGQVAVLSSGYLGPDDSLEMLDGLRSSRIYRSDQNSYLLYPDKPQVRFLERNVVDPSLVDGNEWIQEELRSGRTDFVEKDSEGKLHFNTAFRSARELASAIEQRADLAAEDAARLVETYESVFRHRQFTGRSGSMYKYEGLGSIYWHMVSKLLLAAAEVITAPSQADTSPETLQKLIGHFDEIKEGLGVHKTPARYGAFTTDPYSHTPGFTGVQQPGMTGQVKEDVITRFSELGVRVDQGEVAFAPTLLRREEFLDEPITWSYRAGGEMRSEDIEAGCLAFSLCTVPVIYRAARSASITVFEADGKRAEIRGNRLGRGFSQALFRRERRIQKIVVDIPDDLLR